MTVQTSIATVLRKIVADDGCQIVRDGSGVDIGHVRKSPGSGWWWHLAGEDTAPTAVPTRAAAVDAVVGCLTFRADIDTARVEDARRAAVAATGRVAADPAVEFVRLGWQGSNGQGASIDFRAPVRTADQMIAMGAVARCGWAESFVYEVWPVCSGVEFGREGSAVLYVTIPATSQQAHGGDGQCVFYTDAERVEIAERVIAWARSVKADEISTQQHPYGDGPVWNGPGERPYKVRIWWD